MPEYGKWTAGVREKKAYTGKMYAGNGDSLKMRGHTLSEEPLHTPQPRSIFNVTPIYF